nr:histidine phosphatase family protein [Pseudomonas sp. FFPRI_1]
MSATVLTILVSGFVLWPGTPLDLGVGNQMQQSGAYRHWQGGEVIALVRHAERCDRSEKPCLGPEDGITLDGSSTASEVGQAFRSLGMAATDVFSSPATRTRQTSEYMFQQPVQTQDWLANCGDDFEQVIKAHKSLKRNLVLVTHSDCISDLERQLGYEHALASEYTSSLFVTLNGDGSLQILGIVNARNWPRTLEQLRP